MNDFKLTSREKPNSSSSLMDLEQVQRIGIAAAYQGAEVLRSRFGSMFKVSKKGRIDLVTEADTEAEHAIIETIASAFPDHSILAEESGLQKESSPLQWIIDPLDGTTNFVHGLSLYAVSIAFAVEGEVVFGIVLSPPAEELFMAVSGEGATLNGRPVSVSSESALSESLLVTGFPYSIEEDFKPISERFIKCLKAAQGVRRLGSAALDLCYVACGRFTGFWEQNIQPWDTAAGFLLVQEAGGRVTDYSDQPYTIGKREILATNGMIHQEMLSLLSLEDSA